MHIFPFHIKESVVLVETACKNETKHLESRARETNKNFKYFAKCVNLSLIFILDSQIWILKFVLAVSLLVRVALWGTYDNLLSSNQDSGFIVYGSKRPIVYMFHQLLRAADVFGWFLRKMTANTD